MVSFYVHYSVFCKLLKKKKKAIYHRNLLMLVYGYMSFIFTTCTLLFCYKVDQMVQTYKILFSSFSYRLVRNMYIFHLQDIRETSIPSLAFDFT